MNLSVVNRLRVRNLIPFFKSRKDGNDAQTLSEEDQARLKNVVSKIRTDEVRKFPVYTETLSVEEAAKLDKKCDMDSIRARGMKYRFNYTPPPDVKETVEVVLYKISPELVGTSDAVKNISFKNNIKLKFQLLNALGGLLHHAVRNSDLHKIQTVGDVVNFYNQPFSNLTKYAQMARGISESLPQNLHVIEHPFRFHPDDKDAYHGGITAFPGSGGEVYGLRNRRLFRQFQPKKDWFDYEDQSFNYSRVDKDMPWDPVVAERMDHYPNKRYNLKTKKFYNNYPEKNEVVT